MSGIDQYTKIMLHFDGSDGGTVITDFSAGAHTFTARGNGHTDTGIKQFGTAALLCDGNADYVDTPDSADFTLGTSDWTVDFWFNVSGGSGDIRRAFGQVNSAGDITSGSISGRLLTSNIFFVTAAAGSAFGQVVSTTAFTSAGWHHFAFVRTGNVLKLFIDGVQEGGDVAFTLSINDSPNNFSIGRTGEITSNTWRGSIDEFRLSVGIARWTANFTPPSAAYTVDQEITAQPFTNDQTFFAATMVIGQTITASLFTNTASFFAAALSAVKSITGALFTNTQTFFASSTLPVEAIFANLFTNTQTFFSADIEIRGGPIGPITDLYRRTSGKKIAFWRAVAADRLRRGI